MSRELLTAARQVLQQSDLPGVPLLLRTALERAIARALVTCDPRLPRATGRSKLLALRLVVDHDTARRASYLWGHLSTWCHHHAYELNPQHAELLLRLDETAQLIKELESVTELRTKEPTDPA